MASFDEMIKIVNENPDYRVLPKDAYESLLQIATGKTSTPILLKSLEKTQ